MLREDLKKVNVLRTVCPGCGNKVPFKLGRSGARVGVSLQFLCTCVWGSIDLGATNTHGVRGLHCPMYRKPGPFVGKP